MNIALLAYLLALLSCGYTLECGMPHCSCGCIFSRYPPAARDYNKTPIQTRSVVDTTISLQGMTNLISQQERGWHPHNSPFMCQKCSSTTIFYSSSSTSGGNVGLFEHKVVLCNPFIFSIGLHVPEHGLLSHTAMEVGVHVESHIARLSS